MFLYEREILEIAWPYLSVEKMLGLEFFIIEKSIYRRVGENFVQFN